MAAYMDAKAASDEAAAAEDITAAVEAKAKAVAAQATAETAAMEASDKGTAAEEAVVAELLIDGVTKSVGDTSIMADTGSYVNTTGTGADAQTVITGLLDKGEFPEAKGVGGTPASGDGSPVLGIDDDPDTPAVDETVKHVQDVTERTFAIGKTLESPDDTAGLMLVTQYAGTKLAFVYRHNGVAVVGGTKAGHFDYTPDADDDQAASLKPLKSKGMYYRAGVEADSGDLDQTIIVGPKTKAEEVFSHDNQDGTSTVYVVLTKTEIEGTTSTYTYTPVDVDASFTDKDGADTGQRKVKAAIPEAADYKHIHFGVWAGLGAAEPDGSQKIADLGIGFVQSIGEGLTVVDMPNNGDAKYSGNWVATVREADDDGDGDISLTSGAASLTADFTKATITADLTDLAKLEGAIDNNTFSGTKATVGADSSGLEAGGTFMGTFSGGFYGDKAAEAGGVFDFTSDGATAGEFRGAFGGDRK